MQEISKSVPPRWHYSGPDPKSKPYPEGGNYMTYPDVIQSIRDDHHDDHNNGQDNDNNNNKGHSGGNSGNEPYFTIDLGSYRRDIVTNSGTDDSFGRQYFDIGLRLMLSYQHEMASRCFLASLEYSPYCVLSHAFVALCHSPNYNFKGEPYYESSHHIDEVDSHDLLCVFPSQQVADRHSKAATDKIEQIRRLHKTQRQKNNKKAGNKKNKKGGKHKNSSATSRNGGNDDGSIKTNTSDSDLIKPPELISDLETQLCAAIRILTCQPGVDPSLSVETVGRPYADSMRNVYKKYPNDPDVAYFFAESLMVLNAWQLYEYPTGKPIGPDIDVIRTVLEGALKIHKNHAGLCHMYVHLSEMSAHPEKALIACGPLRDLFPHAGHLIHMPTHIDVLVGDYENCIRYNYHAILADQKIMSVSPQTSGVESFYFGYTVHNYHMAVYGAILGAMESKAMEVALQLNKLVNEDMFVEYPDLTAYLESYSALEIHVMIRFGRWKEIINDVQYPKDKNLMLFRSATICFAKGLAYAALGDITNAEKEYDRLNNIRENKETESRILHNNSVAQLLEVDSVMLKGELLYRQKKYDSAFSSLRKAVYLQDNLNYDEPWGKMQPIRHALGGLLLEQNHIEEAMNVFQKDLVYHPNNPWALIGLINCLKKLKNGERDEINNIPSPACSCDKNKNSDKTTTSIDQTDEKFCMDDINKQIVELTEQYEKQRQSEWADFDVQVACECCQRSL